MSASGKLQGNNPVAQNTYEDRLNSIKETIDLINGNFRNQPGEHTLLDLHDLWDECIKAAIAIPADNSAQNTLFKEIDCLGYCGRLHSKATKKGDVLWDRYPLLAEDVLNATLKVTKDTKDIKKEDTLNLAAFTARFVGTEEHDPFELLSCALVVLRETLETQRRLNVEEDGTETPVADLLPAAVAWFEIAGWKLARYCYCTIQGSANKDDREPMLTAVGLLAQGAVPKPGFSDERWHFWKERLEQLSSVDDEGIKEQAQNGKKFMHDAWEEMLAD